MLSLEELSFIAQSKKKLDKLIELDKEIVELLKDIKHKL